MHKDVIKISITGRTDLMLSIFDVCKGNTMECRKEQIQNGSENKKTHSKVQKEIFDASGKCLLNGAISKWTNCYDKIMKHQKKERKKKKKVRNEDDM